MKKKAGAGGAGGAAAANAAVEAEEEAARLAEERQRRRAGVQPSTVHMCVCRSVPAVACAALCCGIHSRAWRTLSIPGPETEELTPEQQEQQQAALLAAAEQASQDLSLLAEQMRDETRLRLERLVEPPSGVDDPELAVRQQLEAETARWWPEREALRKQALRAAREQREAHARQVADLDGKIAELEGVLGRNAKGAKGGKKKK